MNNRSTFGFAGAALLAVGTFLPLVSLPIVGSLTYFNNGQGDGVLVLVLALLSALIVAARRFRALWLTGLASLVLIGYSFVNMSWAMAQMQLELADNPFRGLATAQMQWGWAVLVLGAILLLAAASRPAPAPISPEAAA